MANELQLSAALKFVKGPRKVNKTYGGVMIDITGSDYFVGTQTVGTSAELVNVGDVSSIGYILVKNLDTTNYVSIRNGASGADVIDIPAGGVALFQFATGGVLYAIADTAACIVEFTIIEV